MFTGINIAQTFQLVDVNTSNFPNIEANVLSYDANYLVDSIPKVTITENGQNILPTEFKAPKSSVLPSSILLVLDVSSSMYGRRIEMLKKTCLHFIRNLPLEATEVAIASFSDHINLNCDFTHNQYILDKCIENLYLGGGTSFNNAFLTPLSGAVDIAEMGSYKKVIIFITDGLSDVLQSQVSSRANSDSTIINCITIGLPISDELKTITRETGGNFYSDLNHDNEIEKAFEKIYKAVQVNTIGTIKWKSLYSCQPKKNVQIRFNDQVQTINFIIPDAKIGHIEATPTSLNFDAGVPGTSQYKPVWFKGNYTDVDITSITNTNQKLFGIQNPTDPMISDAGKVQMIEFTYRPKDTIFATAGYLVKVKDCPDIKIDASSGGTKKLVITSPDEKSSYYYGDDLPIVWEGIDKTTNVDFYYQKKGQNKWIAIGGGQNYLKNWIAPAIEGSIRIKGQITNSITLANLFSGNLLIMDGSEFKNAFFNDDGTEIITQSESGKLKNWNSQTGELNHVFEKEHPGDVAFFPGYNRLVTFNDNKFNVLTNRNGLMIVSLPMADYDVMTSFTHINNKEIYVTLKNYAQLTQYKSSTKNGNSFQATSSPKSNFAIMRENNRLDVYTLQPYKKRFTIKLTDDYRKVILHNNREFMVIETDNGTELYNLLTKSKIADYPSQQFLQFSNSGAYLLTSNNKSIKINDLETGALVYRFKNPDDYTLSENGNYMAKINGDRLTIIDLTSHKKVLDKVYKNPQQAAFYPNSNKILFTQNDSLTIIDLDNNNEPFSVFADQQLIKMIDIAPNEKSLLLTTPKAVVVWVVKNHFDSDTTPFFPIKIEHPTIADKIDFGKHYINQSFEKYFPATINNNSRHRIIIDSVAIENKNSCFRLVSKTVHDTLLPQTKNGIELQFKPESTGKFNDALTIYSANRRYKCVLTGEGINQSYKIITPVTKFPEIEVYRKADTLIPLLKNTGTEPIHIKTLKLNPVIQNNFKLLSHEFPYLLKANDTLWVKFSFNPSEGGRQSCSITLEQADHSEIQGMELFGTGLAKKQVIIAGKTIHALTRKELKTNLTITSLTSGRTVYKGESDKNGNFAVKLVAGLNYSITADLKGYFSSSVNIDLQEPQQNDTIWATIELTPIELNSVVRLNNIFFEFGKAEILDISKPEMKRLVKLLIDNPDLKIEIHGHTDNIGQSKDNIILSELRARAVKEYLVKENISPDRIKIKFFGEDKPVASNDTEQGRKANRRVEIKFIR